MVANIKQTTLPVQEFWKNILIKKRLENKNKELKLLLQLINYAPSHEDIWRSDLVTKWRWVVSFTP
jgi:flavorubredoxin